MRYLSKPYPNSSQINSKQLQVNQDEARQIITHSSQSEPTTKNFSARSKPTREVKFRTGTHKTNLIKIT